MSISYFLCSSNFPPFATAICKTGEKNENENNLNIRNNNLYYVLIFLASGTKHTCLCNDNSNDKNNKL
jgi:hypothetical protein